MIYTNNISETTEKLEKQLNERLGSEELKIIKVEHVKNTKTKDSGIIEIQCFWCLSISELIEIKEILEDNFFVTKGNKGNILCIWTTYKIEDE